MELEGFAARMEGIATQAAGLKGSAIAGPHEYGRFPAWFGGKKNKGAAGVLRVANFCADLNERLASGDLCRGDQYSGPTIHGACASGFAAKARDYQCRTTGNAQALVPRGISRPERDGVAGDLFFRRTKHDGRLDGRWLDHRAVIGHRLAKVKCSWPDGAKVVAAAAGQEGAMLKGASPPIECCTPM